MKVLIMVVGLLGLMQVYTAIKLVEARHEVRALKGEFTFIADEVSLHDEMLERMGDDLTFVETKVRVK